ncbi:hypothetical protein [Aquibaculum sediminis]|uniref:hypothetical protein n=1 Tax=Aquibaculum sediminis TaxID=3231907 RepID=UPI003453D813
MNWKILAGLALILVAFYAVFQNIVRTIATEANVNTELHGVVTPIDGLIAAPLPRAGEMVGPGHRVRVRNNLIDERSLFDLQTRIADIEARERAVERRIAVTEDQIGRLRNVNDAYLSYRSEVLKARQEEVEAEIEMLDARWRDASDRSRRIVRLGEQGAVSQREAVSSRYVLRAAEQEKRARQANSVGLEVEREALAKGLLVTDTWSESPQASQRLQLLEYETDLARLELEELGAQRRSLYEQLAHERFAVELRRESELVAPVGRVWWRGYEGRYLTAGESLGDVAVCEAVVVTATLVRSDFEKLSIGTPAVFTPSREEGLPKRLAGQVDALVGATTDNSRRMALSFGRGAAANGYGAIVRLDHPEDLSCGIGVSGRLELMPRGGAWLDLRSLSSAVGNVLRWLFGRGANESLRLPQAAEVGSSLRLALPERDG